MQERETVSPLSDKTRTLRSRLNLHDELQLALLPTATVLIVFAFIEVLSQQRLLFASLASSAFLIYVDPEHATNTTRTLTVAQLSAAGIGLAAFLLLGPGYLAGGLAMLLSITVMVLLDAMHPPAVATSLAFAFRPGQESNLLIFSLALAVTVGLVGLQRLTMWRLLRFEKRR